MIWKVYILYDPRTNKPFYVGKGKKYRVSSATINVNQTGNTLKKLFLEEIKKEGMTPVVEIVAEYYSETDALEHEQRLIKEYGRIIKGTGILANYSEGGDSSNAGWVPSDQTRLLWSSQRKGVVQTQEHIEKRVSKTKGKIRDEDQRRNCAMARIKRSDPEIKARIIKELENTVYYHGMYQYFAKKFNCEAGIISRMYHNMELYKEALNEWL